MSKAERDEIINNALAVTESFEVRVNALVTVPDENKERLVNRVKDVRKKLSG